MFGGYGACLCVGIKLLLSIVLIVGEKNLSGNKCVCVCLNEAFVGK